MSIEEERKAFDAWHLKQFKDINDDLNDDEAEHLYQRVYSHEAQDLIRQMEFNAWQASANREGYKLVPVNDINISDMIWGKCPCGSSRSPIVSDREGYNLIHCFACGANKYIHEDY